MSWRTSGSSPVLQASASSTAQTLTPRSVTRAARSLTYSAAPAEVPRPLTAPQDQLRQQEFLRRNDLGGNVFLWLRHTGMRVGECADLSCDCLRSTGPEQWAIPVPLGKLKTERMVPVDCFVCEVVQRLAFFRSRDPLPADGRLRARPRTKEALVRSTP
jgi:site-specific recombinase XerD